MKNSSTDIKSLSHIIFPWVSWKCHPSLYLFSMLLLISLTSTLFSFLSFASDLVLLPWGSEDYNYLQSKTFTRYISKVAVLGQYCQIHSEFFQSVHSGLLFQRFFNYSFKFYIPLFCVSWSGTPILDITKSYLHIFCFYQFLSDPFYFFFIFINYRLFSFLFSVYFHILSVI